MLSLDIWNASNREALMSVVQDCGSVSSSGSGQHREKWGRILVSIVWFGSSLMLAVLIPDIGQVIQILGSLAAVFIFVFPGKQNKLLNLIL